MAFEEVGVKAVVRNMDGFMRDLDTAERKTGGLASAIGGALKGGAIVGGVALAGLAGGVIFAGTSFLMMKEKAELTYGTLLGGADKAKERISELSKFAAATPFELAGIVKADTLLQTFGARSIENLTLVGDAAAGVNVPIEEVAMWFGRATDAIKNGKPFGEAAARLQELGLMSGETRTKMEEMTKAGASEADILAVLQGELGRYSGLMEKQSHTMGGLLSTAKDTFAQVSAQVMQPFFEIASGGMQKLVDITSTEGFTKGVQKFSDGMSAGMGKMKEGFQSATSESGFLNVFATKIALGLGIPKGSEQLMGFGNTVKGIFGELASRVGNFFTEFGSTIQDHLLPPLKRLGSLLLEELVPAFVSLVTGPGRALVELLFELYQEAVIPLYDILMNLFVDILEPIIPALARVATNVGALVEKFLDWIRESGIIGIAMSGIKTILELVGAALTPVISFIADFIAALSEHEAILIAVGIALGVLLAALFPIPAAIIGLTLLIGYLREHWDEITEAIGNFKDMVLDIPVVGEIIERTFSLVRAQIEDIIEFFKDLIDVGREIISFFTNIFQGDWEAAWQDIKDIAQGVLELFLDFLQLGFLDDVLEVFSDLPGKILAALGDLGGLLLQKGKDLLRGMLDGVQDHWDDALRLFFVDLPMMILEALGDLAGVLWTKGTDLIKGLWNGAVKWSDENFEPWLRALPGRTLEFVGDVARTLWQKGIDFIAGLAGGVWERAQAMLSWFGGLPTMLLNRIGDVAGLFFDVGWALIKGIADGVADAWDFFKDEILGKADPRNWGIPGLSPFLEAYEHAGRLAGEALTRGISQGIGGISTASMAGALGGLVGAAGGAGFSLGEGLKIMLGQAFGEEGLGGMLKELRDVVRGLHGEMSRLLGLPTVESAEEQLRLAELELQRFQLEEQAAAERADREIELATLRDRLASEEAGRQGLLTRLEQARQEGNVALVAQLEEQLRQDDLRIASIREEIAITGASLGSAEMKIASIDRETEAIKRLAEERRLENAVLEARALAADETLLSDAEMKKAAEEWIKQIAAGTSAIEAQVGDIWTQFIPALEAIEKQQAANAAAAEDARRRETQAFIDAIEAQIAAAQQAAALAAAIAAGGGLGAIGIGMGGESFNARLARSLQGIGGQAFSLFLAAAAEGLPTEQILRNFFGQGGLFAGQLDDLSTLLMSEGIRLAPDFSLTDLIAEAQALADTMNQTASGAITSMAQSVTTAVAPITMAVQDFVATGATFLADSTGVQQAELERRLQAEEIGLEERLGKQREMADYVVRNHMRVTDQLLAAVAGASRMISLFERAMLTVLRKAEGVLGASFLPAGGLGQALLPSLAPSAGMAPIVLRSGPTIDISQAVTASESNLPAMRNAMRMMNIELAHSIQNNGGI